MLKLNTTSSVFVTGATGFVGKMLCHSLVEKGYHVSGTVRSPEKIGMLPGKMNYRMIDDIGPETDWAGALDNVDTVVYLAARVHVMHETSTNPLDEYRRVNTLGAARLFDMAVKSGVRRIIYLSTIKVNGERTEGYQYSEVSPVSPTDAYARSKWEAEQILQGLAIKHGIEVVIIRPPLIYGPGVGGNFLRLLNWVSRDIPLPLALVNNSRSLIFAGNLVDVIETCITHPDAAGETFLVSDGEDISTPDLFRMIAGAMNKKARLIPLPEMFLKTVGRLMGKGAEIERLTGSLRIDSRKVRKVLGWRPPFTVEEGIRETVKWYKNSSRPPKC
ncbi:MAG: SDR family oxidoreductase [Nitrospirae bacterium]|nr:SDR family oxidoreductase [Nitrospirota bacterium]